MVPQVGQF